MPAAGVLAAPVEVPMPQFEDFAFIGNESTCVLEPSKTVSCWGQQPTLGIGATPQRINGLADVRQIAGGWLYACALITDAGTLCWGDNSHGQLGDGTNVSRSVPQQVGQLRDVARLEESSHTPCVSHFDGGLSCWGDNDYGGVGDGTTDQRTLPVSIALPAPVRAAAARGSTRSVVLQDGSVWAWGWNNLGAVGSTPNNQLTPFNVGLSGIVHVESNGQASCALDSTGSVWCWGTNVEGQIGTASVSGRVWPPRKVEGITNAVQLVATTSTFCVLLADGRPMCWGRNWIGEVGDGTLENRFVPTPVLW